MPGVSSIWQVTHSLSSASTGGPAEARRNAIASTSEKTTEIINLNDSLIAISRPPFEVKHIVTLLFSTIETMSMLFYDIYHIYGLIIQAGTEIIRL
jgi:hypothetical protein